MFPEFIVLNPDVTHERACELLEEEWEYVPLSKREVYERQADARNYLSQ
jgi:hypothetical protein